MNKPAPCRNPNGAKPQAGIRMAFQSEVIARLDNAGIIVRSAITVKSVLTVFIFFVFMNLLFELLYRLRHMCWKNIFSDAKNLDPVKSKHAIKQKPDDEESAENGIIDCDVVVSEWKGIRDKRNLS
ncbi:MAG: hypothetical protein K2L90_04245 [Muribaculaceae bacterium]|nr:hypothetical protein [Muribaculaceae bacterium]